LNVVCRFAAASREGETGNVQKISRTQDMGLEERWQRTLALWPYVVPLITVYFAEYSMQVPPPSNPRNRTLVGRSGATK